VRLETLNTVLTHINLRTRNRMLASALNFAAGFWGIPYEHKYLQSITIEARGVSSPLFCT
jgi:hypothetical protein